MKKVALILALVALAIVSSYAGAVMAAPDKPAVTSGLVQMDSFSGNLTASNGYAYAWFTYPQVRHVSVTLMWNGVDMATDDTVSIQTTVMTFGIRLVSVVAHEGFTTWEFDADNWNWCLFDEGGEPVSMWYWVTVTYPGK